MNPASPQVLDLSGPLPADPREQLARVDAQNNAGRGFDIRSITEAAWTVCNLCSRPAVLDGHRSTCCAAPYHVQGWRVPHQGTAS